MQPKERMEIPDFPLAHFLVVRDSRPIKEHS